jgi:hypothetical protein
MKLSFEGAFSCASNYSTQNKIQVNLLTDLIHYIPMSCPDYNNFRNIIHQVLDYHCV